MNPFPLILSSPSGGGKTTIARHLRETRDDIGYSVSCTTRGRRRGEKSGVHYHFWTDEQFREARRRGEFAEWAVVHGKHYGTLRREVDGILESGYHVVLDIDVQGARQLMEVYPGAVTVFILPPSVPELVRRLKARKSEDRAGIRVRLQTARAELLKVGLYDYVVINEDLDQAVRDVSCIIDAESVRRVRSSGLNERIKQLSLELRREIKAYS